MATDGSNPRLDRIEKIIQQGELANSKAHESFEKKLKRSEKARELSEKAFDERLNKFDRFLRRWAALGVKEARNQRRRSAELDDKIGQLAAAQLITEEKLQRLEATVDRFISSRNRNGHAAT